MRVILALSCLLLAAPAFAEEAPADCFECRSGDLITFDPQTREVVSRTRIPAPAVPERAMRTDSFDGMVPMEETQDKDMSPWQQVGSPSAGDPRKHVRLSMTFVAEDGTMLQYICSGTLIDATHVVTAGHCVYMHTSEDGDDVNDWATTIRVVPAYNNGDAPFGSANSVQLHAYTGWTDHEDFDWDLAVIDLDRPVGALTGWRGFGTDPNCSWYEAGLWEIFGYPGEGPSDGETMWVQNGVYDGCESSGNEIYFDRPGFGGTSGGGSVKNGAVYALRSNTSWNWDGFDSFDVKINGTMFNDINTWIAQDTPGTADLIPLAVSVTDANVQGGDFLNVNYLVNNYSSAASGSFVVEYYLSLDNMVDQDDVLFGTAIVSSVIGPKSTKALSGGAFLPCGLGMGVWNVGVRIVTNDANPGNNWTGTQDVDTLFIEPGVQLPVPSMAYPLNGSNCEPIAGVTMSWSAVSGAIEYEVELTPAGDFSTYYNVNDTYHHEPNLLYGHTYTWRVRASADCSTWSNWSPPRQFRTEPNPHVYASLTAPTEGETCVSYESANLNWTSLPDAATYDLQISDNWCYEGTIYSGIVGSNFTVTDLTPNTTYYWRVRENTVCGDTNAWSSTPGFCWTFKTAPAVALAAPTLEFPQNGSQCESPDATVNWGHVPGWGSYEVQLGTACGQGTVETTTGNGFTFYGLDSGIEYHWRARTFDACGVGASAWSGCRTFWVDDVPPVNPDPGFVVFTGQEVGQWANNNGITVVWPLGSDACNFWVEYGVVWDESPTTIPDTARGGWDPENAADNTTLPDGANHWLHVRSIDEAGNWALGATHVGPFMIDGTPPPAPVITDSDVFPGMTVADGHFQIAFDTPPDNVSGLAQTYVTTGPAKAEVPKTEHGKGWIVQLDLQPGSWDIYFNSPDVAGNLSTTVLGPFHVDDRVEIFSPSGDDELIGGSVVPISWSASASGQSKGYLEYTLDGVNFTTIDVLSRQQVQAGSYSWTVPNLDAPKVALRLGVGPSPDSFSREGGTHIFRIVAPVAVAPDPIPGLATDLHLSNHPNPFNPQTTVSFELPRAMRAKLTIYDSLGRVVRTLADGVFPAGRNERIWNGLDDSGRGAASGVYHYRLTGEGVDGTRRMTLLK